MIKHTESIQKVLLIAFFCNVAVAVLKLIYGFHTDTLSMVADGFHSVTDGASSLVGYIAVRWAAKPSDEDHHYGHFKYETMAALAIAFFIAITSWEILKQAYHRMMHQESSHFHYAGLPIMLFGMLLNLGIARYERKKGKEYQSIILETDAYHSASDFWVSLSVLISLACIYFKIWWVDPVVSVFISIYFAFISWRVLRETTLALSDAAYIDTERVRHIIGRVPGVISCHQIRTRGRPGQAFVDLHIQVDAKTDTYTSHKIAHEIESKIKSEITGIHDVLIHTEPYPDLDDEK